MHDIPVEFVKRGQADAWPLCGTTTRFQDVEGFDALMIAGRATTTPRMRGLPVRIPLPKVDISSIYIAQAQADRFFFSRYSEQSEG